LVLFFVPGFVATQVYVRNDPTADASHPKYLLSVAVWSAIVHVVVFPWTADVLRFREQLLEQPDVFVRWFVIFLLITPALLGLAVGVLVRTRVAGWLLRLVGMSIDDRMPTAWDYAFRPGRPGAYVRVHLRGSDVPLAGKLGKKSLAGVSPEGHDLFLEESWNSTQMDGSIEHRHRRPDSGSPVIRLLSWRSFTAWRGKLEVK
jgi:hypothetical protein